jgi:hypothetical protein
LELKIDSLKKELATIEGQPEAVPVELTQEEHIAAEVAGLKALFAKMVRDLDHDEPARVAADNLVLKTCCDCYSVQPVINAVCELCGSVPITWMPAREYPANRESDNLHDAAKAPIDRVQTMLRSGWCAERPERERVVKNILEARLRQRDDQQKRFAAPKVTPATREDISGKVRSAIRLCDIREAKIAKELEELRAKSGQPDNTEGPNVPWHQEPAYLLEKKQWESETGQK